MGYDPTSLNYEIYSEDFGLLGSHSFSVTGILKDHPTVTPTLVTETIMIIDPCLDPFLLNIAPPIYPAEYSYTYTGTSPSLDFTPQAAVVDPYVCVINYSCEIINGPRLDICNVDDGLTQSSYDSLTGQFTFKSIDMANYPAGTYKM